LISAWIAAPAPAAAEPTRQPTDEIVVVPRPKEFRASIERFFIDGPVCVVKVAGGPCIDYAARELAGDLEKRVGTEVTVRDNCPTADAKFVIEIKLEPSKSEGYRITSKVEDGAVRYIIAGNDPRGALYGAFTAGQVVEEASVALGRPAAPTRLAVFDYPAMETRLLPTQFYGLSADDPKRAEKLAIFDWVARWRINATWIGLGAPEDGLRRIAREADRRGIALFGVVGFRGLVGARTDTKAFGLCPSDPAALARVRGLFEKGARAGCRGFAFLFDDLSAKVIAHHKNCPRCKGRFKSTAEWQLAFIKEAVEVARRYGVKKVVVCPTPYKRGAAEKFPDKDYFRVLCSPDFMKDVLVFHCDFFRENIRALERRGLRNYIWWNNGLWTTTHYFDGVYMGLPRLHNIWYGSRAGLSTVPEPIPEAMAELKRLAGTARHVYPAPTGSFAGKALGGSLAWDPTWTVENETTVRRRIVEMLFGRPAWEPYSRWESNLLAWFGEARTHSISFDKTKAAGHVAAAERALEELRALRKGLEGADAPLASTRWHRAALLGRMRDAIAKARRSLKVPEMPAPVALTEDDKAVAPEGVIAWLRFSSIYDGALADYTSRRLKVVFHGEPARLKRGVFDNALFFNGRDNYAEIPAQAVGHLNPGKGPFSVECWVFMMGRGWDQFAAKRGTNREIYRSVGWSIGCDRVTGKWRFTIEDAAAHCVSLTSKAPEQLYNWHHLVGVRDAGARRVHLYVDGRLMASTGDTTGDISNTHPFRCGRDEVAGFYFWGFLDEVRVWDRALSADEVRASFEAGRRALDGGARGAARR